MTKSRVEDTTNRQILVQIKPGRIAIATLVLLFLAREPLLLAIGDFLIVHDDLRPADVIHVIAGADFRTTYAIQLYQQGYGKQIFFTGGWCEIHNLYHAQRGRDLAQAQGVPPEAIAIDDSDVTSTYSEAVRLKEFIAQSTVPVKSVIVVSDPFHMRRARLTYEWVLGEGVSIQMAPVPFSLTPYQREWWTDEASRQYVKNEYEKIVYYYARYRLTAGPLRDWLASLDTE